MWTLLYLGGNPLKVHEHHAMLLDPKCCGVSVLYSMCCAALQIHEALQHCMVYLCQTVLTATPSDQDHMSRSAEYYSFSRLSTLSRHSIRQCYC